MKLYEISELYHDFMFAYENGEIPEEVFADTLNAIEETFNDKADNVACMIKSYEAEAAAIKEEIAKLQERQKGKQRQAERLRGYLAHEMQSLKIRSIESPRVKLSFRKSELVEIQDETAFIETAQRAGLYEYLTYKAPAPNKTAIKAALKNGLEVLGAELVQRDNLQIK